jgi:hypothetical protein
VLNHPEEDEEREDETVNEELVEPEGPDSEGPEPIRVESDDSPDEESEEDKTLVDVFFNIETYCESQPRNTGMEQAVEGDESDFSINDL